MNWRRLYRSREAKANLFLGTSLAVMLSVMTACSSAGNAPATGQDNPPPIPAVKGVSHTQVNTDWQTDDIYSFCYKGARVFVEANSRNYNDSISSVPGNSHNGC